jgi:6-phosphogluconolactonase
MKWAMRLGAMGVMLALSLGLTACGGGSSSSGGRSGVSASYTVGGTVSGLASGESLTLQDNGGDDLVVTANGSFTFSTALDTGASYAVTVLTQPKGQTCTVANGSGTVSDSDITNVAVTCWTESVLYSFTGGNDGTYPYADLVDVDGTLYGTTYEGGTSGYYGTVFEINPSTGEETVLYSFAGGNDGANPYAGLVMGSNGILYGTTLYGGTSGAGTVFQIVP